VTSVAYKREEAIYLKIKDLKKKIEGLDDETDIFIALRKGYRPYGYMKDIKEIEPVFDQDSHKLSYSIDVDIDDNSLAEK
jgi:hypothetical protein